jgi:phage-related protein
MLQAGLDGLTDSWEVLAGGDAMSAKMLVIGYLTKHGRATLWALPDSTFSVVVNSKLVFDFESLSDADEFAASTVGVFEDAARKLDDGRAW